MVDNHRLLSEISVVLIRGRRLIVILIILFLVPIIPMAGFDILNWVYAHEIAGRYFVTGAFAVTLAALYLLRTWQVAILVSCAVGVPAVLQNRFFC